MTIFSKVKDFMSRHRNKFLVSGAVVVSIALASRYAQRKLREWQEKETKEFLDRTRKQQHFESTERTCNQTILSLSITLNESLLKQLNTEEIIAQLKKGPGNRMELWDQLKIMVFTRVTTLVYACVMIVITLRVQLNLVGGYLYKDAQSVTSTLQEKYLSICHYLLESGIINLSKTIDGNIKKVVDTMDLKRQVSLYDIEQIFWAIQAKICENSNDPIQKMTNYIMEQEITDNTDVYSNMIRETADLLESEEIRMLASTHVNRAFSLLIDKLSDFYTPNGIVDVPSSSTTNFVHPSKMNIPLAKLIPILNGFLSKNSFSEVLIQQLITDDKLKTLGANIYEVFSSQKMTN